MDPGQKSPTDVLITPEVAALLRCHPETVYRLVADGKLHAVKVGRGGGRHFRFRREDVEAFLAGGDAA
jgi:excisionase family DNA binding protein